MSKEEILAELEASRDRLETQRLERDRLVIQALAAGASGVDVAKAAGVSRAQLYNIKKQFKR